MVRVTFFGGVREIGGNKILVESDDSRIMLDFGMSFSDQRQFYDEFLKPRTNSHLRDLLAMGLLPAMDGIYRGDLTAPEGIEEALRLVDEEAGYLWESSVKPYGADGVAAGLDGVLLSHAHIDHCQYISILDHRIPVYMSPLTHRVLDVVQSIGMGGVENQFVRATEKQIGALKSGFFAGALAVRSGVTLDRDIRDVVIEEPVTIGSMTVTPMYVDHSVLGATSYLIEAEGKSIFYSGDFRFHGLRSDWTTRLLQNLVGRKVDAMLIEGTRISENEQDDEGAVRRELEERISEATGLAMVSFAWKDTSRFLSLRAVAEATGRTLVISPKLAYLVHELRNIPEANLPDIEDDPVVKVYLKRTNGMLYSPGDYVGSKINAGFLPQWNQKAGEVDTRHLGHGVRAYQIHQSPEDYIVHMDLYDFNELIDLSPPSGSLYIRAMSEPFDDEGELDERRIINWLERFDINPPEHQPVYVHASGHASGGEIKEFINRVQPRKVFPIHTQHPELYADGLSEGIEVVEPTKGETYEI